MTMEDRELLAVLTRLNTAMTPLAILIMDGSASIAEQQDYAQRLVAAGERLWPRANETTGMVVGGEFLTDKALTFPAHTVEPYRNRE